MIYDATVCPYLFVYHSLVLPQGGSQNASDNSDVIDKVGCIKAGLEMIGGIAVGNSKNDVEKKFGTSISPRSVAYLTPPGDEDKYSQTYYDIIYNDEYNVRLIFDNKNTLESPVDQACLLINNSTETGWFQKLLKFCDAVCFLNHRLPFWSPDFEGEVSRGLQGQVVFYIGRNVSKFTKVFSEYGVVINLKENRQKEAEGSVDKVKRCSYYGCDKGIE